MVESHAEEILNPAVDKKVAFLVVGDPFGATTHSDLYIRARDKGIEVEVIHNASIMNAVGCCGLQLYRFGHTISVPFFTDTWKPNGFYESIKSNMNLDLHTLVLLDIKVKEPDFKAMMKGITRFEPPRFMTVNQCLEQLLEVEETKKEGIISNDLKVVGLARIGQSDQRIIYGKIEELIKCDFGKPLHCVIIPSKLHDMEEEMLNLFKV